jgi:co-chaperonin GroES (HSP10)
MTESKLLYVPEQAKDRCDQGIVKYVGPLVKWVKVGDHVLFSGYSGTLLSVSGEGRLIVLPERFIHAKVDSPDTDIPGLYFRSADGAYFLATYEVAMELMAEAFKEAPWIPRRAFRGSRKEHDKSSQFIFAGHEDDDMVADDLEPPNDGSKTTEASDGRD